MTFLFVLFSFFLIYLLFVILYPTKRFRPRRVDSCLYKLPDLYLYSFQLHVHSQFSYDSLGKPEDITRAAKEENIDYVVVTDHENDSIKHFADERLIGGLEKKITGEEGKVLGDLLMADDLRVVAHPFKEKYRWKLDLPESYFIELIDLKDVLLERKALMFFLIPYILLTAVFSKRLVLEALKKLIDLRKYAGLYLKMGIRNRVVGGLDHHVKLYIREVGIRFLFPSYKHSFKIMRNFLISNKKIDNKVQFIEVLREGMLLISFSHKPTLYWKEDGFLKVLPSEKCLLIKMGVHDEECYEGSFFELKPEGGLTMFLGYTYIFSFKGFYFGLKPLFLFLWKEADEGKG